MATEKSNDKGLVGAITILVIISWAFWGVFLSVIGESLIRSLEIGFLVGIATGVVFLICLCD